MHTTLSELRAPPTSPRPARPTGTRRGAFVRDYATLMRPYLLFVSGAAGVTGLAFVPEGGWLTTSLVFLASFLTYGFGQALTDCFQTDTDSLSAPYRPLCRGSVSRGQVLATSLLGLGACVLVYTVLQPTNALVGLLGLLGLLTYTAFKRLWWAGPFYNAWIVVLVSVLAYTAGAGTALPPFSAAFTSMLGVVFFGYAHFVLVGYFKDIRADAATGYRTLPVVFGRRVSVVLADLLALLTALCALPSLSGAPVTAVAFQVAGLAALAVAQWRLRGVRRDAWAYRAIVPGLHGFVLLLCGVAVTRRPDWAIPLLLYWLAFEATLRHRPSKSQV